jgi:hypothetical protein
MTGRLGVVILAAVLLAIQVVRVAAVAMASARNPNLAAALWSRHPSVETSAAMTMIAQAARSRRPVPRLVFDMMADVAAKEPLAPEPYLVRGVEAELDGDGSAAQRAFEEAQWRDPRSLAAAYFLADRYFRTGKSDRGLMQLAALIRLSPNASLAVAPYLAAYARSPANWPALRTMFRKNPNIAVPALTALAGNIETAPAVIALADPGEKPQDARWLAPLIATLTQAGKYQEARAIWARITGADEAELLHDPAFADPVSPPPFNWALTSSTVGVAERQPGRLHVVFYGQEDGILASQLLLLEPGRYQLSFEFQGNQAHAHSLTWSIWCDGSDMPIASVNLDLAASRGWTFSVPQNCPAQTLRLSGVSADIAQQADLSIASLKLRKAGQDG